MAGKDEIVCNPTVFDSREVDVAEPSCFVVMPFSRKNERMKRIQGVYENHIKPAVVRSGLRCVRGDDFPAGGKIMEQIWEAICQAEIIIGEFTTSNPNVIYEVGIAHTLGKPMIGIIQDAGKIPFDHLHLRFITYEDSEGGYAELGCKLEAEINKQRTLLKQQGGYYPKKNKAAPAGPEPAQQLRQAERQRDTLRAEKDELQSKYAAAASLNRTHASEKQALEKQITALQSTITEKDTAIAALQAQFADLSRLPPSAPSKALPQKSKFVNGKWTNLYRGLGGRDWLVLDADEPGGRVLLITKNIVGRRAFSDEPGDEWEACTLRSWLNSDKKDEFLGRFSREDRDAIEGEVFLLSAEEAMEYFSSDHARAAKPKCGRGGFWWWLRSPGGYLDDVARVGRDGGVDLVGCDGCDEGGVRPALWLNL